jgi:hypothetical protein
MVADINPGTGESEIMFGLIVNNKLVFQATNGDHATATDFIQSMVLCNLCR